MQSADSTPKLERKKSHRFSRRFSYSIRRTFKRKRKRNPPSPSKQAQDTSYEKLVGEKESRRGSVPSVPDAVAEDSAMMDTPSTGTPSRFTNFLIRKGFKTNLKRTKSSNKLDRKRQDVSSTPDSESTFVGTLKRTMSLGRLTRKRTRTKSSELTSNKLHQTQDLSVISSRLKNSQSHESLLTTHSPLHSVDLTAPDMEIRPLHASILTQNHCFQVSTMHGSKYISCRTAEERDKWMQSLRKTANPQQENSRRAESSLKLWVQEAKNVPSKKRYFCEVCLDKILYARTSVKNKGDMLFWGEQFEFNNLPSIEFLVVNLYREADKKKKKDRNTLVGYAKIAVSDVSNRQYVERWFHTSSGTVGKGGKEIKTDLPLIRLKVRYQTVQILPVELYKDMSKFLGDNYVELCDNLEPLVNIKDKEEIATTLIKIMQKLNKAKDFLSEVVMCEVLRLDNNHLTFRGNSIATKSMEAHMKLVGEKYLNDTLGDFVRTIIVSEDDCEVDPTRVPVPGMITRHQTNLRMYCDMAWTKIITSSSFFPMELRSVFACFRERCEEVDKDDLSDNLISASIFLRFLCPAILSPSLFHLTQEFPTEKAARNLTLIAKTIQTLANFSKFGAKEEYMTFMNDFVEEEETNMKGFIGKISSPDQNDNYTEFDGYIDMGKEMSIMHTLLNDTLQKASPETMEKLSPLTKILDQVDTDLKDPNVSTRKVNNRTSQHYDNLVNIQAHIDHTTSPTELLRDMLQKCGDSSSDPMFTNGNTDSNTGSLDNVCGESTDSNLTEDSNSSSSKMAVTNSSEVGNVSVSSRSTVSESHVNKTWNQMVSAAEIVNGDYIDLISFMDEEGSNNMSVDMEQNGNATNGSQTSIGRGSSTVASSGYQSYGSPSPLDNHSVHAQGGTMATPPPARPCDHDNQPTPAHAKSHHNNPSHNNNNYTHSTPLSFSNPMYRHTPRGVSSRNTCSPIPKVSSNSSLSSEDSQTQHKCISPPVRPVRSSDNKYSMDTGRDSGSRQQVSNDRDSYSLRKKSCPSVGAGAMSISQSSSVDSVPERDLFHHSASSNNMCSSTSGASSTEQYRMPTHSQSNSNVSSLTMEINTKPRHCKSNNNVNTGSGTRSKDAGFINANSSSNKSHSASSSVASSRKHSLELRGSSPMLSRNVTPAMASNTTTYYNTIGSVPRRTNELSHSLDFSSVSNQRYGKADQMRRTATDTSISQRSSSSYSDGSGSPRSQASSDDSSLFRRLSAQNAVHMGIRSVQRRIHEQEKTKQEYESEVTVLKQQLIDAQKRLHQAEAKLEDHESETNKIASEWQTRLEESEERMRKQQAEKDDQMKNIIQSASFPCNLKLDLAD